MAVQTVCDRCGRVVRPLIFTADDKTAVYLSECKANNPTSAHIDICASCLSTVIRQGTERLREMYPHDFTTGDAD